MSVFDIFNKYKNKNKNSTNDKFHNFINGNSFRNMRESSLFHKYARVYDGETEFKDECKSLYILTENLQEKYITKKKIL
tara:strand:+ start:297 stop:533 length:237 start_codon:yes stop_codon:yes gene_type:complete